MSCLLQPVGKAFKSCSMLVVRSVHGGGGQVARQSPETITLSGLGRVSE